MEIQQERGLYMGNLLTQSLKILKDAAISQGKDYMENAVSLVDDANMIRTDVMRVAKNSTETLKSLKRGHVFRNIQDWFYQKSSEYGDDDEFDPGFDTGKEDSEMGPALTRESIQSISDRQSNVMVQIGAKQAETSIASTAEIVSTINTRSSELLTSVNNINTTLLGISKKLDAFTSVYYAEKEEQSKQQSLYDSNGRLSLNSIYQTAKNSSGGYMSDLGLIGTLAPTLLQGGPTELLKLAFGATLGDKNIKALGGKSINETMESINTNIGEAIQRGLEGLISNEKFINIFGDLKRGTANKNYKEDVINGFTNKPTPFDGYTRTTIIKTIPEYLRIIAKGITGINYNVSKDGSLSQGTASLDKNTLAAWNKDESANQAKYKTEMWGNLSQTSFKGSGIGWSGKDTLYEERLDKNLTKSDIDMMASTLNGVYVYLLGNMRVDRLEPAMLKDGTMTSSAVGMAARILQNSSTKKVDWVPILNSMILSIAYGKEARNFCNGVNKAYQVQHEKYKSFASSGSAFSTMAGRITEDQVVKAGISKNKETVKNQELVNELYDLQRKLYDLKKEMKHANIKDQLNPETRKQSVKMTERIEEIEKLLQYGSGNVYNQTTYGNYLNIAKSGCGPVALADMLNRRGLYDPNRGMSAAGYMNASAMMGQPLIAGNVSNMTLRNSSPNNPITLIGSGSPFGTAYGNNHFVNVLGTDGYGNVYVMNPLDGKIHKQSINDVANSSIAGLYGAGIGDNIVGKINSLASTTGEKLYGAAKDKVTDFIMKSSTSVTDKIDWSLQKSLDRAKDYGNSDKVDEDDRTQMNLVLSLMETALEDGDGSGDKQAIMAEISKIKNQKLRARLRSSVSGMLERAESKKSGGGILGRLLTAGKGILKNFFAPLISGITTVATKVLSTAKKFFTPVIDFFKKSLTKHAAKVTGGASDVWTGVKDVFRRDNTPKTYRFKSGGEGSNNYGYTDDNPTIWQRAKQGISNTFQTAGAIGYLAKEKAVAFKDTAETKLTNLKEAAGIRIGGVANAFGSTKIGEKLMPKLSGITKILGGMGKMLSGVSGILLDIFMGVQGFKTLTQTLTSSVTSVAKSFNGVFKSINKSLKPALTLITRSLSSLVKNVGESITPLLESLGPVLEAAASIISNLLPVVTPVVTVVSKTLSAAVKVVSVPIKIISSAVGGIAKLLHVKFDKEEKEEAEKKRLNSMSASDTAKDEFAKKYAKLIHPVSKKKREDLYEKIMSGEVTEADAKKMLQYKLINTTAVLATGGAALPVIGAAKIGAGIVSGITKGADKVGNLTNKLMLLGTDSKDETANRLARLMHPIDNDKRLDTYEKIMSGQLSVEEAEKMVKRKAIITAGSVAKFGPAGLAISPGIEYIVNFLKGKYDEMSKDAEEREEKHDKQHKEAIDVQKSIFKKGPLKILSSLNVVKDASNSMFGLGNLIFGGVETGLGGVVGGLGRVIHSIGELASFLPFVSDDNSIAKLGESLLEGSDKMINDGNERMQSGYRKISSTYGDFNISQLTSATASLNSSGATISSGTHRRGTSPGVTYYSSGDIPASNANIDVIGSGDSQTSFGNYLNMARRGCGPVALADAYNRRTGSNVNARKLASSMIGSGSYDPSSGTSVAGYVRASNAMGMRTTVGGVTAASLKRATPNNPITLVGSGSEFGTRSGNNHYLNAIGTDRYGGVYVSNPMTGKIQRRSANSLAGSSLMGIYGSGDENDFFSDDTKEAMRNLISIGSSLTKMFQLDNTSDIDEAAEEQEKADQEEKTATAARDNYTDEEYQSKVLDAMEAYKGENPIRDGESTEAYEKRISDAWNNSRAIQNKYITMVTKATLSSDIANKFNTLVERSSNFFQPYVEYQRDSAGNIVHDEKGDPIITGGFKYLTENENSDYVKAKKANLAIKHLGEALTAAASAGSTSGAAGGGVSGTGTGTGNTSDLYEAAAQVWEGAAKKLGTIYSYGDHGPITTRSGVQLPELHPDCSGMISAAMNYMGYTFKGTMNGSTRRWTTHDISGKTSNNLIYNSDGTLSNDWAFIPYSPEKLQEGDILTTPSHVGLYIRGDQPDAYGYDAGNADRLVPLGTGAAKAYLDRDASWKSLLKWTMGPGYSGDGGTPTTILRYVGGSNGSALTEGADAGSGTPTGTSAGAQGKIKLSQAMQNATPHWKYYPDRLTKGGYWDQAKKAGFTTAQTAMVAAIGIHENGARKLTGEESLTRVVWDNIGKQYAFGLMNWIPDSANSFSGANETKYGTTLADQLKYIRAAYFDPNSTYDRAKNVNFNRYYGSAMQSALGYAPKLKQNDRWGPYAETDLAESMGHYVGNALVPYDFNQTTGQARHMRTAVEAYNWMLDNGVTNGYATGTAGSAIISAGTAMTGFNLSSILGDYANDLPDYYKNMLTTVQSSIDTNATAAYNASMSSSSDFGDYSYEESEADGDAEALEGNTNIYATNAERKALYDSMHKKYKGGTAWSNSLLTTKGYGTIYLYLEPSTSSKITAKLSNNKTYTKVASSGNWVFVYAQYNNKHGYLCGWGQMGDFVNTSDVKNKTYQTTTVNKVNSAADARRQLWKGTDENTMFYFPSTSMSRTAGGGLWDSKYKGHWFKGRKYSGTNKYATTAYGKKTDRPYVTLTESYDRTCKQVNQDVLMSNITGTKTLKQLFQDTTACGDVGDIPDLFLPNVYGSGDEIPPLDTNIYDKLIDYGYNTDGSYTVNNYTITGGINNNSTELSRTELLNYLLKNEYTTRSPRTEKILNKILAKLDTLNPTTTTDNTDTDDMYEKEIPEVIAELVRG